MAGGDDEEDQKKQDERRCWSELPQDILSLVRLRLFVGDYFSFNAVCKSWQSAPLIRRQLPPPIDCLHYQSPCLMVFEDNMAKFFHPIYNDFYSIQVLDVEIAHADIRFCNYGWLLMSGVDPSVFFYNPFSKVKIQLPDIPEHVGFTAMCFTSPPTSSDCLVIGVSSVSSVTTVGVLRRGGTDWLINRYLQEGEEDYEPLPKCFLSECSPIWYRGFFYFLDVSGFVGVYDPTDESWGILKLFVPPAHHRICRSYLAELDGDLLAALEYKKGGKLWVFRLDFVKMGWVTVPCLEDKMLYVSRGSSFAETSRVKGMANKIYVPKFFGHNGAVYAMKTRKYHSLAGDFSSETAYKTRHLQGSSWIMKPTLLTDYDEHDLIW